MAKGASIKLEYLIALRNRVSRIHPTSYSRAFSHLAGSATAHYRGRGIDFEEVRHYQAGDEPRSIDWRVTARSGQAHTKLFREERERPILLVVDQRSSMAFGSRNCFKSVVAAEIAAALGWSALANRDRVGALLFADKQHAEFRPAAKRKSLLRLLTELVNFNHALLSPDQSAQSNKDLRHNQFNTILDELRQIARPGTAIFLLSDFSGMDAACFAQLAQIRRHCDVTAIAISDPLEAELPDLGSAWFSDGSQRCRVDLNNQRRQRFSSEFRGQQQALQSELLAAGIATLAVSTEQDVLALLEHYFSARPSSRRRALAQRA